MKKPRPKLLSKSRFTKAFECPTKLYYQSHKEYVNTLEDDQFLRSLRDGGFQVGALAKLYYPDGVEVETLDIEEAVEQTTELLKQDKVTIFEAAFRYNDFLVRVDVLKKTGEKIDLIEVKSKTFHPDEDAFIQKSNPNEFYANWEKYIYDVAYQTYVVRNARKDFQVTPYLMLADKSSNASVDGLNQNFLILYQGQERPKIVTKKKLNATELGDRILKCIKVEAEVDLALVKSINNASFEEWVANIAKAYASDTKIETPIDSHCKGCEFRPDGAVGTDQKSGFAECWSKSLNGDSDAPLVLDLWNNRNSSKQIQAGAVFLRDLSQEDFAEKKRDDRPGMTAKERQWIQVSKVKENDQIPHVLVEPLREELRLVYPLHFIDFETASSAIPFHKGMRPYETIAFQFSHHVVSKDGSIEHANEFINVEPGHFPNFDFVRALKKALSNDNGTIFRYAAHENTVLCAIHAQLKKSDLPKTEIEELCGFIESITTKREGKEILWDGKRSMVDLLEMVKGYYYHPATGGSNSLKYVLPATLNESQFLKQKYAQQIYGAPDGIKSRNFTHQRWVQSDANGNIRDPYEILRKDYPIFSPEEDARLERFNPENEIGEGGAAMMAYCRTQFTEMSDVERKKVAQALLRYCELDTLAMVFLWEYFQSIVSEVTDKRPVKAKR